MPRGQVSLLAWSGPAERGRGSRQMAVVAGSSVAAAQACQVRAFLGGRPLELFSIYILIGQPGGKAPHRTKQYKPKGKEMTFLPRNSQTQVPTHSWCLLVPPPHPEMPNHLDHAAGESGQRGQAQSTCRNPFNQPGQDFSFNFLFHLQMKGSLIKTLGERQAVLPSV